MPRALIVASAVASVCLPPAYLLAQPRQDTSIVGVWTFNRGRSDTPPERGQPDGREARGGDEGQHAGHGGGAGGYGGGRHGGGFGAPGRPDGPGGGRGNAEDLERRRQAMRDLLEAPERMTITRTDSMVIITTGDGRTTRLAIDGTKVKDQSTGIERKSRIEGDRLISEITGAGPGGKIVETYAIDPESHELIVSEQMESTKDRPGGGTRRRVYDPQQP